MTSIKVRVKTAKKRKSGSTAWLKRHLNDEYVHKAKKEGYRSRAAYKLIEINSKFRILQPNYKVLDFGAAPGGWSQISAKLVNTKASPRNVFAVDLLEMDPVAGVEFLRSDFNSAECISAARQFCIDKHNARSGNNGGNNDNDSGLSGDCGSDGSRGSGNNNSGFDVILSDIAANTTGIPEVDHLKMVSILEDLVGLFCHENLLQIGGTFVAKTFKGGTEQSLLQKLKIMFATVKHFKPESSRKESSESYLVCLQYRGGI